MKLRELLRRAAEKGASDLHLKSGSPPGLRIDGILRPQADLTPVTPESAREVVMEILSQHELARLETSGDLDVCWSPSDRSRWRVHAFRHLGTVALTLRRLPDEIPTCEQLGLTAEVEDLSLRPHGLVLVSGRSGSGKTTTLAAMVDAANQRRHGTIVTIEDPVEYLHRDRGSYVTQREVGRDCQSFAVGLKRAMRQDADVIVLSDLPDYATVRLALAAAESGRLVMAGFNGSGSVRAVRRLLDLAPEPERPLLRLQLADLLQGILFQVLVPKAGGGRIAVRETLVVGDGMRALLREGRFANMLYSLRLGGHGTRSMETALAELVFRREVSAADAHAQACDPEALREVLAAGEVAAAAGASPAALVLAQGVQGPLHG
jgi:twitching motility protein PilT